ncbi:MAG: Calcium-transporting ATPase 1 [Gammaproteobacteria bacterium]|jgi:Ca2+-transporting ATPase|nr:Calcium-transporting ATPase 1 [Gammaproteobacteria bacterium]
MRRTFSQERINRSFSPDGGLDSTEVEKRRTQYGANDIIEVSTNRWRELAKNTLLDPMIWFLVGTSALFAILAITIKPLFCC